MRNQKFYDQVKANKARYVERNQELVRQLKSDTPCTDCGIFYHWFVMDFDHVRGKKDNDLSVLVARGVSLKRLIDEIAKCEIVCSNCHRKRTFGRM